MVIYATANKDQFKAFLRCYFLENHKSINSKLTIIKNRKWKDNTRGILNPQTILDFDSKTSTLKQLFVLSSKFSKYGYYYLNDKEIIKH